jgi:hypothetical protein
LSGLLQSADALLELDRLAELGADQDEREVRHRVVFGPTERPEDEPSRA